MRTRRSDDYIGSTSSFFEKLQRGKWVTFRAPLSLSNLLHPTPFVSTWQLFSNLPHLPDQITPLPKVLSSNIVRTPSRLLQQCSNSVGVAKTLQHLVVFREGKIIILIFWFLESISTPARSTLFISSICSFSWLNSTREIQILQVYTKHKNTDYHIAK